MSAGCWACRWRMTDKITKLIPGTPGMTLDKALAQSPDLAKLYNDDPQVQQIIDIAKRLEGLCRNAGMHAAGVIIADQPLENFVPLYETGDGTFSRNLKAPSPKKSAC